MSAFPSRGLSRTALEALSRVEPTAAAMLHDDRLVHLDGVAVADAEQRPRCPFTSRFATVGAAALVRYRAHLAKEFGLPNSSVLLQPRHAREIRRLLASSNIEDANRFMEARLASMSPELHTEIALEGVQLLPSRSETAACASTCQREHQDPLHLLFVVTCVYAQAWDEAWATDVFGLTFP